MGEVIPLRVKRSCWTCIHHEEPFCLLYDEFIDSEIFAARHCTSHETA